MDTSRRVPELLAPAGNMEKLKAALRFGADAVYLAGKRFGMRAAADNFTPEQIAGACTYAHAMGKKVYVAVNTMPRTAEYAALREYLAALGGTVAIPGLDDTFDYNIPEGTQTGTTFRIAGKGLKTKNGTGNLYVKVFVEVPARLSRDQRKKLEEAALSETRQYDKAKKFADGVSALYGKDPYRK